MAGDERTPGDEERDRFVTADELRGGTSDPAAPIIDLGAPSGEVVMPHWTAPPTGQVPAVVLGVDNPVDDSGVESLRWRDEHDTSDHADFMLDLAATESEQRPTERLGALDRSERTTDVEFLNFDDVELDPRRRARRSRRSRTTRPDASVTPAAAAASPTTAAPAATSPSGPAADAPAGAGGRDVPRAALVGVVMAVVALGAFSLGAVGALIVAEIVIVAAGVEFFGALQRNGYRPVTLIGVAAIVMFPLAAYWKGEAAFPLVLALTLVVGILWYLAGLGGRSRPLANLAVTLLSVIWIGMFGAFAALILAVPAEGVSILLLAVVGTVGSDVGAFFIGRAAGRTPLSKLSPNKTVEGLIGGVVGSILAVFLFSVVLGVGPFSAGGALLLGIVIAAIAPLGDLAESLIKRDLGIKDMGTLLPQHGGVLDRFDGMLFVLPAAYYVARLCGLAG